MIKKYLFLVGCILLFAHSVYADISQFVFITPPQSVAVNTISDPLTVQSQNSAGISEAISETYDLLFTSTSATGQFLNSSGNAVSTTMSKNTANRTFYYRDPTAGTFTLAVTATGRTSKNIFTANQSIIVGSGFLSNANSTSTPDTSINNTNFSSVGQISATYYPVPVSEGDEKAQFEVSSGRDRLSAVGSEVLFRAVITKINNVPKEFLQYSWSFGDGGISLGKETVHIYRFSGEYNVVLTAYYSDFIAVSRSKVMVISPKLSISRIPGGIMLKNSSNTEINLGGWIINSGAVRFEIPRDTIVSMGKEIIFSSQATGIFSENSTLVNSLGEEISKFSLASSSSIIAIATTTLVSTEVKDKKLSFKTPSVKNITAKLPEIKKENSSISSSSNIATVYVGAPKSSFSVWAWFTSLFK